MKNSETFLFAHGQKEKTDGLGGGRRWRRKRAMLASLAGSRMAKRTVTRRRSCCSLASGTDTVGEPARAAACDEVGDELDVDEGRF
jgi:hypothetical protein